MGMPALWRCFELVEKLDLRGLLCPEPVIRTKKLFDKNTSDAVEALVDDDVCVANLQRLAKSLKASCKVTAEDGFYQVRIERALPDQSINSSNSNPSLEHSHNALSLSQLASQPANNNDVGSVIFLTKETLGEGDAEFGKSLLNIFLQTMLQSGHMPRAILMVNSGVKLMKKDSPFKKVLEDFKNAGTDVLACGLCVDYYKLKEDVQTEQITNMFAICEYLGAASKVISP